jgi:hypothetical protein
MVGPGLAGYLLGDDGFSVLLGMALASSLVPLIVNFAWNPAVAGYRSA